MNLKISTVAFTLAKAAEILYCHRKNPAVVTLYDLSGFRLAAEDAFQLPVDLVTTECSDHAFLDEITKEGVLLYRES